MEEEVTSEELSSYTSSLIDEKHEEITTNSTLENSKSTICQIFINHLWSEEYCLGLKMRPGIHKINILGYFSMLVGIMATFEYVGFTLIFMLKSPKYYNIDKDDIGMVNGNLGFYVTLARIFYDPFAGTLHEIFGRKTVIVSSFLILTGTVVWFPFVDRIYPTLLIVRILQVMMHSNIFSNPLVPDYVLPEKQGFAAGYTYVICDASFMIGSVGLFSLNDGMPITYAMMVVAAMVLLITLFLFFSIQDPRPQSHRKPSCKKVFTKLWTGLKVSVKQPILMTMNVSFFMIMCTNYCCGAFMALFITSFFGNSDDELKEAHNLTRNLNLISTVGNILISGIFGFLCDYLNKHISLLITHFLMGIAALGLYINNDPHSISFALLFTLCFTMTTSGKINSQTILNNQMPVHLRGVINGFNLLFATGGLLMISKSSGEFYTYINHQFTFAFVAILDLLFVFAYIILYMIFWMRHPLVPALDVEYEEFAVVSVADNTETINNSFDQSQSATLEHPLPLDDDN